MQSNFACEISFENCSILALLLALRDGVRATLAEVPAYSWDATLTDLDETLEEWDLILEPDGEATYQEPGESSSPTPPTRKNLILMTLIFINKSVFY